MILMCFKRTLELESQSVEIYSSYSKTIRSNFEIISEESLVKS